MDYNEFLQQTLKDPARLEVMKTLALLDSPEEEVFDRLTRLATRIVNTPVSLVALVDHNRQFFKSQVGLPTPWAELRETPLSHSFCQHVMATNEPLIVEDSRKVDLLKNNLAIPDLNVIAYLGVPLTTRDGLGLGSFCVIDSQPRQWTDDEVQILRDLGSTAMSIIELRAQVLLAHKASEERVRTAQAEITKLRTQNTMFAKRLSAMGSAGGAGE